MLSVKFMPASIFKVIHFRSKLVKMLSEY